MKLLESVSDLPDMLKETYDLVAQVPLGRVTTYGEVARALGDIAASRFVGRAMSMNQDIVRVPCRRVVQSDGSIGGYTGGGPLKKIKLLREEGVKVSGTKVVDLEKLLFKDFESSFPLRGLRERQRHLKKHLDKNDPKERIEQVAGIDVAYDGDHAFAAMVVFDNHSREEVERYVIEGDARFPYIPTYLAFREIPVIAPLMKHLDDKTAVMYDGNGILHPEGFGVASQVGVVFDTPTIGVAKKLLCGKVARTVGNGVREVRFKGKVIGHALSKSDAGKPVYVSVGHRISPHRAQYLASKYLKFRIPQPTRLAHIVAETARHGTNNK